MKKYLLTIVITFTCVLAYGQNQLPFSVYTPTPPPSRSTPVVPRNYGPFSSYTPAETQVVGTRYMALVVYKSSAGGSNSYKLPVIVNNGRVDAICFNNGGSVHIGINNSGYKYYGGGLEYTDDDGLDGYITTVKIVYDSGSWSQYVVYIPD